MAATIPTQRMQDDDYRRELGDGLVLRWSSPDDAEKVALLYSQVFRPSAEAPLNAHIVIWTRDMFSGRHPNIGPRDFAVVEDTRTNALVASTCLLGYECEYEGIPFRFGRPEVVASLPEYRRRGLIRAIIELVHARSDARGDLVQGITGIPYYYRQFGYEFAAELGHVLNVYFPAIPALKAETTEPYTLRLAALEDVPLLRRLWDRERGNTALSTVLGDDYWRWLLVGMHADAMERARPYVIVAAASGRAVGYLLLAPGRWDVAMMVDGLAVEPGVPLTAVVPSVLRGLRALADTTRPIRPETPPAGAIGFRLSRAHPLREALAGVAFAERPYTYAWYLRVPNLPAFVRHIAPVLERRLADSALAGYSGDVTLDFYRGGLRLAFEGGKLTTAEDWQRPLWGEGKAGFPPLVFLQLLFGYRGLEELRHIYPDAWAEGDAAPLLAILFPPRPSNLVPLD
ncbi:MAG: GNAT family N-acetyltransferase [Ktedonobacterales bacterium]